MIAARLKRLLEKMTEYRLDAFLVSTKANKYYLSGFTGTDGQLLLSKHRNFVIADGRYFEQLKQQSPSFEIIDSHMNCTEASIKLIHENGFKRIGIEANDLTVAEFLKFSKHTIEVVPTENFVEYFRMTKDKFEKEKILKACSITDKTFEYILDYIKPGMSEREVANEINRFGLSCGASSPAFETIVASGVRSALPHGHASDKIIKNNELVILDFGFMYDYYFSDITRTIAIGNVSEELKRIYKITLEAQRLAISKCDVGIRMHDIDQTARDIISENGYGESFLHGTGHSIGLSVHEYPLVNNESMELLKNNMIFTVEPGIYIEGKGGVRIEDDVWIDNMGHPQLLSKAPKELIIL
ncbi:M24 family metallopeptidase [Bavariicoccus seileri]|uniref:M24 family metallopeptidase n=1 Tax=Bavariicoccus seileri TaxID=549685 RepID=UPI0003B6B717|nr:aminopeptidase P family protein [Bavariicoccus seileri]